MEFQTIVELSILQLSVEHQLVVRDLMPINGRALRIVQLGVTYLEQQV